MTEDETMGAVERLLSSTRKALLTWVGENWDGLRDWLMCECKISIIVSNC